MKKGDIVLVHWFDAYRDSDGEIKDISDIVVIDCQLWDVGFYLGKRDGYLVIAEETNGDDYFRHIHNIPLANIINITIIDKKRRKLSDAPAALTEEALNG